MAQFTSCERSEISNVARRVLRALEPGREADRQEALAQAEWFEHSSACRDTCATEQIEVLRGALDALNGPAAERVQAGLYLLQHLAGAGPAALANSYTA